MENPIEISVNERIALTGELIDTLAHFFLKQQRTYTVGGNRLATDKARQFAGRIVAAVMYPGDLDHDYLFYAKRLERTLSDEIKVAIDKIISSGIKPVPGGAD